MQYRCSLNLQNKDGRTAISKASENGHINVVRLLIDAGAKVNVKDRKDKTALTYASEEKHKNVVSLLKAAGGK